MIFNFVYWRSESDNQRIREETFIDDNSQLDSWQSDSGRSDGCEVLVVEIFIGEVTVVESSKALHIIREVTLVEVVIAEVQA